MQHELSLSSILAVSPRFDHRQTDENGDNGHIFDWTDPNILVLARLYLQNQQSFVVRRCVQLFAADEITLDQAIERILLLPDVRDDDTFPDE